MKGQKRTKLVDRLHIGTFENGYAPVLLDGEEPVGELHRTPGWIWATAQGIPWGGGKNYQSALRSVAVGLQAIWAGEVTK